MNDLIHKIDTLERQILEKENELQLLKDDLEAIRAALESALEDQQADATPTPAKAPTPPEEEESPQEATSDAGDEEYAEPEASTEPEPVDEEQQHEAIMRTIEEFSKEQHVRKPDAPTPNSRVKEPVTLGDRAGKAKLSDLKKAFGINERFLYANELFNGDMSAFTRALEELNHLESMGDAERLMDENLAQKYKWDEESDAVVTFKSTVSRRFA